MLINRVQEEMNFPMKSKLIHDDEKVSILHKNVGRLQQCLCIFPLIITTTKAFLTQLICTLPYVLFTAALVC